MRYCTKCLYPVSKPDLHFDDKGVCSACRAYENRQNVDWGKREYAFRQFIKTVDGPVIVPVSGGKDSHYQILKCLEYGLKVLAVTASTDSLSPIGRRNLDNIRTLGCDHIEVHLNPRVRRKINKLTLMEIGDISWAEHVTIFTIPVRIAAKLRIPWIIWGENPQNEYGGPEEAQSTHALDRRWLEEFGGLCGLRVKDVEDWLGHDLPWYRYPRNDELYFVNIDQHVQGIFLGHFFPWDGYANARIARQNGFEVFHHDVEGSMVNYENLDNFQTGIHDYFKWIKYGFGRATDLACNHIRRGLVSRDDAIKRVRAADGQFPWWYLDRSLISILSEIDMTKEEFLDTVKKFTNPDLFFIGNDGMPIPRFVLK
jgi:N-acetyl sugar amidotransferase